MQAATKQHRAPRTTRRAARPRKPDQLIWPARPSLSRAHEQFASLGMKQGWKAKGRRYYEIVRFPRGSGRYVLWIWDYRSDRFSQHADFKSLDEAKREAQSIELGVRIRRESGWHIVEIFQAPVSKPEQRMGWRELVREKTRTKASERRNVWLRALGREGGAA